MADIEFNRSAVGINAKKDWEDADFFGQIGAQMSSATPGGVALPLPAGVIRCVFPVGIGARNGHLEQ